MRKSMPAAVHPSAKVRLFVIKCMLLHNAEHILNFGKVIMCEANTLGLMSIGEEVFNLLSIVDPFLLLIILFTIGLLGALLLPNRARIIAGEGYPKKKMAVVYGISTVLLLFGVLMLLPLTASATHVEWIYLFDLSMIFVVSVLLTAENYRRSLLGREKYRTVPEQTPRESAPLSKTLSNIPYAKVASLTSKQQTSSPTSQSLRATLMHCPRCGQTFPLESQERPLRIKCPHCGVEGVVR